ncbi:MAG: hypothetical protein AB1592_19720, partial [Pseudomonadota bacterium]
MTRSLRQFGIPPRGGRRARRIAPALRAVLWGALMSSLAAGGALAQGLLLPPGEIPRQTIAVPGAAHPTPYQMFSTQQAMPAPFQGAPQSASAPLASSAPQVTAQAESAAPAPSAAALPPVSVPLPTPRP